jgi:4-amino-4-deoxy-L-arabinose transferase-like glycosyltransferase
MRRVLLALILLIGAASRLFALDLIEFRHDSAYWALEASRVLSGGYWPLIGQQVGSVAVPLYNGPFMTYATAAVMAIARALFGVDSPVAMAAFIALCNVAAIGMAYALGARLYSRAVGVVAAALFAVAPWLVLYGRMLWPQSFFPLLVPSIVWLLHAHATRGRPQTALIAGVLLGIAVQLHLSALALVGVSGLLMLAYAPRRIPAAGLLAIGVLIGYAPILIYDALNGWVNLGALSRLSSLHAGGDTRLTHLTKLLWNFSNVLSGQGLWVSKLGKGGYMPSAIEFAQGGLFALVFGAAVCAVLMPMLRARRLALPFTDAAVLAFTFAPLVYFAISRGTIQRHYFIFLFPLPFLLIARGAAIALPWLRQRLGARPATVLGATALASMLLLNLTTLGYGVTFLQTFRGRAEYGTAWADKSRAVEALLRDAAPNTRVDLSRVQEPLPYLYLLRDAATLEPTDLYAARVDLSGSASGAEPKTVRIVEVDYHPNPALTGTVIFRSPGIVVDVINQRDSTSP